MSENSAGAKSTLLKNTGLLAVGKFSSQLITFLMLPLYTAFLPPSDYGIVDLIVTYVALLAPALTIQMEMAVFRFLIEVRGGDDSDKAKVISNAVSIALRAIVTFFIFGFIAHLFVDIPYFFLISGILLAAVICGLCLQSARGVGQNGHYAIASIITGITTVILSFALIVVFNLGAVGLLFTMLFSYITASLYLIVTLKLHRYVRISAFDKDFQKELLKYAAPLVPNGVAWWIINAADRTIILIALGLSSNGIYAIASRFPLIFSALFSVFGMSWTESASVHINSSDRDKFFSETFDAAFRFFGSVALGLICAIPLIFPLLIDESYAEAKIYIPIMMLGPIFSSVVGLYSAIYVAKKLTKQVASTSIVAMIVSITINLAFVNIIGLFAAALANALAFLSMAIYRHWDVKKYVTISYSAPLIFCLIVLYGIATAIYYVDNTFLSLACLTVVFFISYWLNRNSLGFVFRSIRTRFRKGKVS